jgi:hypothetical protein
VVLERAAIPLPAIPFEDSSVSSLTHAFRCRVKNNLGAIAASHAPRLCKQHQASKSARGYGDWRRLFHKLFNTSVEKIGTDCSEMKRAARDSFVTLLVFVSSAEIILSALALHFRRFLTPRKSDARVTARMIPQ